MSDASQKPLTQLFPTADSENAQSFRINVEYDGTAYAGWQIQKQVPTIQGFLETALSELADHPVRIYGAGRTDAGVHAMGQVAKFITTSRNLSPDAIIRGGNTKLPADIRILDARKCPHDFDPRRDARLRWYRYSLYNRDVAPALNRHHYCHLPRPVDWSRIEQALGYIRGEHDFSAFRSSHCTAERTLLTMEMARHTDAAPFHYLDLRCRSFLHNMVRLLVGLLVEIGQERHAPEVMRQCLENRKRLVHFRTAPPHGLALMKVFYPEDIQ